MAGDMMMILVVGALLIGGYFLMQSGGLSGILGGGAAAPATPAPAEGEGQEGQGQEGMGDEGPYERFSRETGPTGTTIRYESRVIDGMLVKVPVRVPIGPFGPSGPGPFGGMPYGPPPPAPGPGPYPVPVPVPLPYPRPGPPPCAKFCMPGPLADPVKCRQCKDAMGIGTKPYPYKAMYGRGCSCA